MLYVPDALGMLSAREAVAGLYGGDVQAGQVVLTASTSEAYSMLFRLLCDPGDVILVPRPGYPLFGMLALLDNVVLREYALFQDHGWHIDLRSLEEAITPRTRAILLVHPNNPTGHYTSAAERDALEEMAERFGLTLIVDEVFLEYPLEEAEPAASFAVGDRRRSLTFTLSGLSKVCGMPQMKVAWTVVTGQGRAEALRRIELIADTFLSVATPQQLALPAWLASRSHLQDRIRERVRGNLTALDRMISGTCIGRLPVGGGWCVVLRVPATVGDSELALYLLDHFGVAVHPGSFYGFAERGWLVISLLVPVDVFLTGVSLLVNGINACNSRSSLR